MIYWLTGAALENQSYTNHDSFTVDPPDADVYKTFGIVGFTVTFFLCLVNAHDYLIAATSAVRA